MKRLRTVQEMADRVVADALLEAEDNGISRVEVAEAMVTALSWILEHVSEAEIQRIYPVDVPR